MRFNEPEGEKLGPSVKLIDRVDRNFWLEDQNILPGIPSTATMYALSVPISRCSSFSLTFSLSLPRPTLKFVGS